MDINYGDLVMWDRWMALDHGLEKAQGMHKK